MARSEKFELKLGEGSEAFILESRPPLTDCEGLNSLELGIAPTTCRPIHQGASVAYGFPKQLFSSSAERNSPVWERRTFVAWVQFVAGEMACETVIDTKVYPIQGKESLFDAI